MVSQKDDTMALQDDLSRPAPETDSQMEELLQDKSTPNVSLVFPFFSTIVVCFY